MKKVGPYVVSALAAASLVLAGCSDPEQASASGSGSENQSGASATTSTITPFDVSQIETQDDIAAMVPAALKESGVLRNGASTDYPPAEFKDADGQTPVGYDVDLTKALAKVMGLNEGQTLTAEFPTIIPGLGTKFDVGLSSFSVTPERIKQVNMVSYVNVGSAYAVAAGNPQGFDPNNVCGTTIGVQNGTYQYDYATELSAKCEADGKEAIKVMPLKLQTDITPKVIGGQYDATLADSTVIGFTVKQSNGELEQVGDVIEAAPQGVAIAKDDQKLTDAVAAAMNYLMKQGYLTKILEPYGAESAALSQAEINPTVQ